MLTEVQLLVLSAANHKDEQRVASLWDDVITETYKSTGDLRAVGAKVISLASSMATKTSDYIPIGILLNALENISLYPLHYQYDSKALMIFRNVQPADVTQVFQNLVGTLPQVLNSSLFEAIRTHTFGRRSHSAFG